MPRARSGPRGGALALRLLVAAVTAFAIAWVLTSEIPAMQGWFQRTFAPERYPYTQRCVEAALEPGGELVSRGRVEKEADGFRVDGITVETVRPDGERMRVIVSCTLSAGGELLRLERRYEL
jgi:hypothetical protein